MARNAFSTCMASSRVGSRISACAPRGPGFLQLFDDRDQKAEGLAGAGLCGGQHVAAFESRRNGACLHGGGDFKFVVH